MNNDHNTGNDNGSFMIGQALSGRHLLDSPLDASSYQGSPRFNDGSDIRSYSNTPRPLSRPPMRGMAERPPALPVRPEPVIERRAVAPPPIPPLAPTPVPVKAEQPEIDVYDDCDDSNGLVSRAGCPRGWLITEAELERRFAKLGALFENVEVDTEADRHVVPVKPARPAQSASYTSLFDLPRRARSR